jgi:two-component system, NarL family, nitrate/nitrite response regulator NarL
MSNKNTILLVDDHQMLIDGMKLLISKIKGFEVIGEALSGADALDKIKKLLPQIVISDISMPEMDGITLTKNIKKNHPEILVILLTMHHDKEFINKAVQAGANGYILKNTGQKELQVSLETLIETGSYFGEEIIHSMKEDLLNSSQNKQDDINELTDREEEIVRLIAKEFSTQEIADQLFISQRTVETHRKNIIKKTGVKNIVGIVKFAFEKGWVK